MLAVLIVPGHGGDLPVFGHCGPRPRTRLTRKMPVGYDRAAYRRRNVLERTSDRLGARRGISTFSDEHTTVFHGGVVLASILVWARDQETRPTTP